MKRFRNCILILSGLLSFPGLSFAGVAGDYSVSGKLTSPSFKQCYFSLSIRTEESKLSLSQFSCGELKFLGGSVSISGDGAMPGDRLLKNEYGNIVGTISDSRIQYQESGMTIRITMQSDNSALMQFSQSPYSLVGNMSRK